jgi:hypothetical protein
MQALFRFSVADMIARIGSFVKGSGSRDELSARGHSETRKEISLISDWSREFRLVDVTARRLQTYDFMDRAFALITAMKQSQIDFGSVLESRAGRRAQNSPELHQVDVAPALGIGINTSRRIEERI